MSATATEYAVMKTTKITLNKDIPVDNIFQDFMSLARTYDALFQNNALSNDMIRINTHHEIRFRNMLLKLIGSYAYDIIANIMTKYQNEIYMAGGLLNLAVDPLLDVDKPVFNKSDIDLFILADHDKRKLIVGNILYQFMKSEQGSDVVVGTRGSVIYIWHPMVKRMIQLILVDTTGYPSIDTVIRGFDIDNIALAFNGQELILQKRAWQAMRTRITIYRPLTGYRDNKIYRLTKTAYKGLE